MRVIVLILWHLSHSFFTRSGCALGFDPEYYLSKCDGNAKWGPQLPDFEKLITRRGEQKFIHPSLTQSHSVPSRLWVSGASVLIFCSQNCPTDCALRLCSSGRQQIWQQVDLKKSVLQTNLFKSLNTLCASNGALCSPTPAWLLMRVWKRHERDRHFSAF